MNEVRIKHYQAPSIEVIEIEPQGAILTSSPGKDMDGTDWNV